MFGEPFEDKVKQMAWTDILTSEPKLIEIVFLMAHQPENVGFLKYVHPQILKMIY